MRACRWCLRLGVLIEALPSQTSYRTVSFFLRVVPTAPPEGEVTPAPAIGLLVLASPDAQRYHAGMGTDFLERIGELAGAALSRLQ